MSRGITIVALVVVFLVALFLGFLMGSRRVGEVEKERDRIKTELQMEVNKARTQKELAQCKWDLVQAKASAENRDFGKATESLASAKEAFSRAASASEGRVQGISEKMDSIAAGLAEIQMGLDSNDVKAVGRITELVNLIDVMIAQ